MRFQLTRLIGIWLLAITAISATTFWEEKDFRAWSDQEIQEMLTNSPWARQVSLLIGQHLNSAEPTYVTFTWKSALPIKQALARQSVGLNGSLSVDTKNTLDRSEPFYAITLSGLPSTLRWLATQRVALKNSSMLARKNKAPIFPKSVRLFQDRQTGSIRIVFLFPKTDPITLDDIDIDIITKLGNAEVKTTFTITDMLFNKQLAL